MSDASKNLPPLHILLHNLKLTAPHWCFHMALNSCIMTGCTLLTINIARIVCDLRIVPIQKNLEVIGQSSKWYHVVVKWGLRFWHHPNYALGSKYAHWLEEISSTHVNKWVCHNPHVLGRRYFLWSDRGKTLDLSEKKEPPQSHYCRFD